MSAAGGKTRPPTRRRAARTDENASRQKELEGATGPAQDDESAGEQQPTRIQAPAESSVGISAIPQMTFTGSTKSRMAPESTR